MKLAKILEKFTIKSLIEKVKNNKILSYVLIAILLIIAVLFFTFTGTNKKELEVENLDYVSRLENRLENVLSNVEGAGKVKVVITLESGMETVLAYKTITTETANGVEIEQTPILVNGKTVTLMEKYPKINGVLIVVEGNSIAVKSRLQQATTSLLDVNLSQIEILTMK